jgi:ribosomal protein S18 acetylase RimI-like enzyme
LPIRRGEPCRSSASPRCESQAASPWSRTYSANWLGIDLSFQDFEAELAGLPGKYAPPEGELLLASGRAGEALGCVALKRLDGTTTCEMKRLYVRPAARRLGLGKALVERIIEAAQQLGYAQMKLDTLPSLTQAFALYRRLGFTEISPYYHNPVPGTRYLGKRLGPGV